MCILLDIPYISCGTHHFSRSCLLEFQYILFVFLVQKGSSVCVSLKSFMIFFVYFVRTSNKQFYTDYHLCGDQPPNQLVPSTAAPTAFGQDSPKRQHVKRQTSAALGASENQLDLHFAPLNFTEQRASSLECQ